MNSEDGSLNKNIRRLALFKVNSCTFWFKRTALLTVLSNYGAEAGQRVCRQVWRSLSISRSSLVSESSHARTSKTVEELKGPLSQLSVAPPPPSQEIIPRAPDVQEELLSSTRSNFGVFFSLQSVKKTLVSVTQQTASIPFPFCFREHLRPIKRCLKHMFPLSCKGFFY